MKLVIYLCNLRIAQFYEIYTKKLYHRFYRLYRIYKFVESIILHILWCYAEFFLTPERIKVFFGVRQRDLAVNYQSPQGSVALKVTTARRLLTRKIHNRKHNGRFGM